MSSKKSGSSNTSNTVSTNTVNNNPISTSSFLENKYINMKDMIHIVIEIIAFLTILYYTSNKINKLHSYIQELLNRTEEQEDRIQKLEEIVKQLSLTITHFNNKLKDINLENNTNTKQIKSTLKPIQKPKTSIVETITVSKPETSTTQLNQILNLSDEESDLDNEIQTELNELDLHNDELDLKTD